MKQIGKEILKENKTGKMCSLSVGEAGEMCSPAGNATSRMSGHIREQFIISKLNI